MQFGEYLKIVWLLLLEIKRSIRIGAEENFSIIFEASVTKELNIHPMQKNYINVFRFQIHCSIMTIFPMSPPFSVLFFSKTYRFSITILQHLHRELYTMNPTTFFVPAFLKAINDNTEQSFRNIMSEPCPGIFVFEMLQPGFCNSLLEEVLYHFNYHYLWYKQYLIF